MVECIVVIFFVMEDCGKWIEVYMKMIIFGNFVDSCFINIMKYVILLCNGLFIVNFFWLYVLKYRLFKVDVR